MSVASQVIQDVVRSDDRAFGENDPATRPELAQERGEAGGALEVLQLPEELKLSGCVELEECGAEFALEHFGEGADGEEPAGLFGSGPEVLSGEAAAGDQAMEMGMAWAMAAISSLEGA